MECKEEELDNLYFSKNVNDIIKFYHCFSDIKDMIKWARSRPTPKINIYEREGNSEILFVIPTPNVKDKLTENLTKSLGNFHIVYSESNGRYFNYAKSVNYAIKEALKYNPKWIIIMNNDIIIEDDINKLYLQLLNIDSKKVSAVIGAGGKDIFGLCKFNVLFHLLRVTKYKYKYEILRKFKVKYYKLLPMRSFRLICYPPVVSVRNLAFFGEIVIVSPYYISRNNGMLFDETYINGMEDDDLLLNIILKESYAKVYFKFKHLVGQSLGTSEPRHLRDLFNKIYFNYKIKKGIINIYKKNLIL